jgi:O-antigen ligase
VAFVSLAAHIAGWSVSVVIQGLLYLGRFVCYSLVFLVVVNGRIKTDSWLWGIYGVGVGFALLGLLQFILFPSLASLRYLGWDPYYYRVFSTLLDPNFTGILLVVSLFLGFYLRTAVKRNVFVASQIIIFIALLLTSSRSSFLALGAGVSMYAILKKRWIWIIGFVVLAGVYVAVPKPAMEAFRLDRTVSSFARVNNWQQSTLLFVQKPILGMGFSNKPLITSAAHVVEDAPSNAGSGIDSSLLFVLVTTGLLGFVCFMGIVKHMLELSMSVLKKDKMLGEVAFVWLGALGVHSLFTNSLFYAWVMIYVWIFLGVLERKINVDR